MGGSLNNCSFVKYPINPMVHSKLNVLLVDDDGIFQFTTKKTLEATGLANNILICSNGLEAIDLLKNTIHNNAGMPDVIFLDINMPVMNGWDFLNAFQSIREVLSKAISIYIVSSSADEFDISHSRQFETVSDYIVKPIMKEKFSTILSTLNSKTEFSPTSN